MGDGILCFFRLALTLTGGGAVVLRKCAMSSVLPDLSKSIADLLDLGIGATFSGVRLFGVTT
jgi:hypothetical protein